MTFEPYCIAGYFGGVVILVVNANNEVKEINSFLINLYSVSILNNEITKITSIKINYNIYLDIYKLWEFLPDEKKDRYNV